MFEFCLFLGLIFIIILAVVIAYWFCNSRENPKIKYKDFRKYYALNPKRWYCGDTYVRYDLFHGDSEYFNFGFISFYRYQLWQYRIDLAKRRKEDAESMQRFLDDINQTEAEND